MQAIVPVTLDGISNIAVECLVPLRALAPSITQPECVIDQDLDAKNLNNQFAVFTVAFLRDCMKEACADMLGEACQWPPWKVSRTDFETWFDLCSPPTFSSVPSQWITEGGGTDGQKTISSTACRLHCKRPIRIPRLQFPCHPWQLDPPLPDRVHIDLTNHHPQYLPAPMGWPVCERNAPVIITGLEHVVVGLDAAQYGMLLVAANQDVVPSELFMQNMVISCYSQQQADEVYYVPWSRHLLDCLCGILTVDFIVGTRAVTSNPHYQHFFSPVETDSCFGAAKDWPPLPALILLDCFDPEKRSTILEQAVRHGHTVWILRLDQPSLHAEADLQKLQELQAKREVDLPAKSLVLHHIQCRSAAKWDSQSSRHVSQLWLIRPTPRVGYYLYRSGNSAGTARLLGQSEM